MQKSGAIRYKKYRRRIKILLRFFHACQTRHNIIYQAFNSVRISFESKKLSQLKTKGRVLSKTIKNIFSVYRQRDLNSWNSQKVGSKANRRERVYKREAQAQRDFLRIWEKKEQWSRWLIFYSIKNRNELHSFRRGADDRIWTCTLSDRFLRPTCLPFHHIRIYITKLIYHILILT